MMLKMNLCNTIKLFTYISSHDSQNDSQNEEFEQIPLSDDDLLLIEENK